MKVRVYVYPDDEQYEEPPEWKSDDYEVRWLEVCKTCGETPEVEYNSDFMSCDCGAWEEISE